MANLATPRTWVVGETVSASIMNQEIRDQMNILIGRELKTGTLSISFTSLDQFSASTVTFSGSPFSVAPVVLVTIPTTAGATSRWNARGTAVTTTQFVPFFQSGTSGATATWASVACGWVALVA